MREFVRLFLELDRTTKTGGKLEALAAYFTHAKPADAAWAVFFLSGRRLGRVVKASVLREVLGKVTGLPTWMIDECRAVVGDLSETMALLGGGGGGGDGGERESALPDLPLHRVVEDWIRPLRALSDEQSGEVIARAWSALDDDGRLVFNKLVRGNFRLGVQQGLLVRALAQAAGIEASVVAHRLAGSLEPTPEGYLRVVSREPTQDDMARPYPFCLAHALDGAAESLGEIGEWQVEYKWDGIRAQVVKRAGRVWIWSRGDELVNPQFPEVVGCCSRLPDGTVLDGEILAWRRGTGGHAPGMSGRPLSFNALQRRLNRKRVEPTLFETETVVLVAFDVLEHGGLDVRARPLAERRAMLEGVIAAGSEVQLSPLLRPGSWSGAIAARAEARESVNAEGLILKHRSSAYHAGRTGSRAVPGAGGTGLADLAWLKWKLDPYRIDAVLVAAAMGTGRRAGLYTDYTFAVRDEGRLATIAKAYSGLSDDEILRVDRFIRAHTLARTGPVRMVEPVMVFELAFEGLQASERHRSGVAVRFPRIARIRDDKGPEEADTLGTVLAMLAAADARDGDALPGAGTPAGRTKTGGRSR